jgi:hypothetical protein
MDRVSIPLVLLTGITWLETGLQIKNKPAHRHKQK